MHKAIDAAPDSPDLTRTVLVTGWFENTPMGYFAPDYPTTVGHRYRVDGDMWGVILEEPDGLER